MIDVAALAVAQMRTAIAAVEARDAWTTARARWLAAGHSWADPETADLDALGRVHRSAARAAAEAQRAYNRACGDALAEALTPPPAAEQPGLFDA